MRTRKIRWRVRRINTRKQRKMTKKEKRRRRRRRRRNSHNSSSNRSTVGGGGKTDPVCSNMERRSVASEIPNRSATPGSTIHTCCQYIA
eukprot:2325750-Rhodomonas_salina.2